jgi:hypothetical protein
MKLNKLTTALVGLGLVSAASVAQANTYIYLTGSTAARAAVFGAATTANTVFSGTPINETGATSGASDMVFEGTISGVGTVDLICHWSGSEAGIAAVAGQTITQPDTTGIPGYNAGNFNLPGVPPSFLVGPADGGNWTTSAPLTTDNGGRGITTPDLSMADTSQAVSLTSKGLFPLKDYGAVAVVPFTWMQGYAKTPYTTIPNVTTAELSQLVNGENPASLLTGNVNDVNTSVAVIGRNKGSGTRVNMCLNSSSHVVTAAVDQWAFDASYVNNVLTFGNNYAAGQTLQEVANDGYDSGGSVATGLEVDGTGSLDSNGNDVILIGYLGISDAKTAHTGTSGTGSGAATFLPFNGVYEGDQSVIQGNYSYWGTEHLLGSVSQSGSPLTVGNALFNGIVTYTAANYGTATGNVTTGTQSILIPTSLMQVSRGGADSGNPTFVGAGGF